MKKKKLRYERYAKFMEPEESRRIKPGDVILYRADFIQLSKAKVASVWDGWVLIKTPQWQQRVDFSQITKVVTRQYPEELL